MEVFVKQEKHFLQAVILVSGQWAVCWGELQWALWGELQWALCWGELQVGHMLGCAAVDRVLG